MEKITSKIVNEAKIDVAAAMESGMAQVMEKTKSKPGEKTSLDSVAPAVAALKTAADGASCAQAFQAASEAAAAGSEATRNMLSLHGRAAYYGDKSIGVIDGGSVVGRLIFESIASSGAQAGK